MALKARQACGYVDDRLRRTSALPPLVEEAQSGLSKSGEMLAFAHIPTGTFKHMNFICFLKAEGVVIGPLHPYTGVFFTKRTTAYLSAF